MADELLMPKLGMTMEEGVLTEWFVQEGGEVAQGDPIFEVMTDKINIEVEAPKSGVLLKVLVSEGEAVPVNQVVGYIGDKGEEIPEQPDNVASQEKYQPTDVRNSVVGHPEHSADVPQDKTKLNRLIRTTPSARRLARIHNIDLRTVTGTGPRGRIQARDVEQVVDERERRLSETNTHSAADGRAEAATAGLFKQPAATDTESVLTTYEEVPLKGIRKVIGERMVQSIQQVPHVTLNRWVKMQAASQFKQEWEQIVYKQAGFKLSINDMLVLAVARALLKHPEMNATLEGETVRRYRDVNIGIAVQTDNGLMVPVLHEINRVSVSELVKQLREKINKARNRSLSLEDTTGATFTISNLGGYDIEMFTPIIDQPQVAILGVGTMVTRPEWIGDTWTPVKSMPLSLSFDHRIVDGAPAAQFLQTLAHYLKEPQTLLI